jgi:uncharacterized cupin superfamily protein
MQSLGALKPAFKEMGEVMPGFDKIALMKYPHLERIEHIHHAGNSSGIVDGAAAVLIGNREFGEKYGLKPRARIRATAKVGTDPTIMLTGPVPATEKILRDAGMTIDDIDLFEVNEAFASVVLRFMQAFDVRPRPRQRQRRRHRHGPPAGRHRRDHHRHAARRDGAQRQGPRPRHALHRLGHGRRHDHREGVMPKIDPATVRHRTGTSYPPPYDAEARGRSALMLSDAGGLTQFGVNVTILQPGAKSSMRHWHAREDEFVMVLSGECVLVEDAGETPMTAGDCAAFPAGHPDGHHFVNRSDAECRLLVVGTRQTTTCAPIPTTT